MLAADAEDVAVRESVAGLDPEGAVEESVAEAELDVDVADAGANATEAVLMPAVLIEEDVSVGEVIDVAEADEKVIVVETGSGLAFVTVALAEPVVEVEDGDDDEPAMRSSEAA